MHHGKKTTAYGSRRCTKNGAVVTVIKSCTGTSILLSKIAVNNVFQKGGRRRMFSEFTFSTYLECLTLNPYYLAMATKSMRKTYKQVNIVNKNVLWIIKYHNKPPPPYAATFCFIVKPLFVLSIKVVLSSYVWFTCTFYELTLLLVHVNVAGIFVLFYCTLERRTLPSRVTV